MQQLCLALQRHLVLDCVPTLLNGKAEKNKKTDAVIAISGSYDSSDTIWVCTLVYIFCLSVNFCFFCEVICVSNCGQAEFLFRLQL